MRKLTVIIPCKNERLNIRACIESARLIASEVLIADSGSTDGTLELVAQMGGCRVSETGRSRRRRTTGFSSWTRTSGSRPSLPRKSAGIWRRVPSWTAIWCPA
jgi:cellulose synthase/poly-beta-1,6-N-acetylglucosamine synthase-like glycosyltransferase